MRVYISGPMAGYPDYNRRAFKAAAEDLRATGHDVVDPGDLESADLTWVEYLRADLKALLDCDGVAVLPCWEASRGACLEVHVAHALGMPVLPLHVWLEAAA